MEHHERYSTGKCDATTQTRLKFDVFPLPTILISAGRISVSNTHRAHPGSTDYTTHNPPVHRLRHLSLGRTSPICGRARRPTLFRRLDANMACWTRGRWSEASTPRGRMSTGGCLGDVLESWGTSKFVVWASESTKVAVISGALLERSTSFVSKLQSRIQLL